MGKLRSVGVALAVIVSLAGGPVAVAGVEGNDAGSTPVPIPALASEGAQEASTPVPGVSMPVEVSGGDAQSVRGESAGGEAEECGADGGLAPAGFEPSEIGVPAEPGEERETGSESDLSFAATGFPDVLPGHAQYSDVMWLVEREITAGWPDGTFRPSAAVSRAAMAAFLYRYAGSPDFAAPAASPFRDVSPSSQFYQEIAWAAASGLATGYADGTFHPGDSVTRGAAAVFLWRLAGSPAGSGVNPFVDLGVCNSQRAAVVWLGESGISRGYADHTFRPRAPLARGDFAAFLHRYDSAGLGIVVSPSAPAKDPAAPQGRQWRDVTASNPFRADILWLSATGVAGGYPDGTFRPGAAVTRDAMAAFLYRFAGSPDYAPPVSSPFKDVPAGHPFYREIAWAAASGIVGGYVDGTFRPGATVSRAAMASFLYRAAGNPAAPRGGSFADTGCSEHRTAISWLAGAGIATGFSASAYRPNAPVERQALAAFLHRMCTKGWRVAATPWSKAAATKDAIPASCLAPARPSSVDCAKVKCVALTFDDGPHPTHTGRILDILKRHNAHATFFVVGTNAARYPSLIRREVAEGHLVGSHTWDHPNLARLGSDAIRSQLSRTDSAIGSALGYRAGAATPAGMWANGATLRTRYIRPPYGSVNSRVYSVLGAWGHTAVLWSADTRDWENRNAVISTRNALAELRPGGIILWHDIHPVAENALEGLMTTLERQGYHFVTVEELTGGRQVPGGAIRCR